MEVKMTVFVLMALQSTLIKECPCFNLLLTPKMLIVKRKAVFTLVCQADVPLVDCQVREFWKDADFELAGENLTLFEPAVNNGIGRCGVTVTAAYLANITHRLHGCRARGHGGGWQYDIQGVLLSPSRTRMLSAEPGNAGTEHTTDPTTTDHPSLRAQPANAAIAQVALQAGTPRALGTTIVPIVAGPPLVIAEAGSAVVFNYSSVLPFSECQFTWPGTEVFESASAASNVSTDLSKQASGVCLITLRAVRTESSGVVGFWAEHDTGGYLLPSILIVKTAPSPPELTVNHPDGHFNKTDSLVATCFVGGGRPIAKITWLLGDDVMRDDLRDDRPSRKWKWQHDERSISQDLRLHLVLGDDGKPLVCRAQHIAWPGGVMEARLTVVLNATRAEIGPDVEDSEQYTQHVWLLIGLAASTLAALLAVVGLICCTYISESWCFEPDSCQPEGSGFLDEPTHRHYSVT